MSAAESTIEGAFTRRRRRSALQLLGRGALFALAIGLGVMFLVPYLWGLGTSLKTPLEITAIPPTWLPKAPQWQNYPFVATVTPFLSFARNTVFLTLVNIVGELVVGAAVAYGFSRFRFRGRDVLFVILLSRMMLPREVTIIPQYLLFNRLGWLDTYWPLIVPHWLAGSSFGVFLLRQFFLTIPREFDDAARVDGANSFQIFWRVLLPLAKPALASLAIFAFIGNWNMLWEPLIYLNTTEKMTLAVGLTWFQGYQIGNMPKTHLMMAYSIMITLPVIVVFFTAQRYFIQGIVLSGLKG
ncbi:MAG TPA: carbohydrate ABC transporter permease [Chloroflexota bacterium]